MTTHTKLLTLTAAIVLVACYRGANPPTPPVGAIVGTLRDTSGAVLDEASVRLRHPGTTTGNTLSQGSHPARTTCY
jgi:hypothetical protein